MCVRIHCITSIRLPPFSKRFSWSRPQGVPYADLDFSKHKVNNKKVVKKSEAMDRSVYSEVRPLTEQEEQQLRKQEDEAVEGPYVPISIK